MTTFDEVEGRKSNDVYPDSLGSFKFTSLLDKCRNVLPTQKIDSNGG